MLLMLSELVDKVGRLPLTARRMVPVEMVVPARATSSGQCAYGPVAPRPTTIPRLSRARAARLLSMAGSCSRSDPAREHHDCVNEKPGADSTSEQLSHIRGHGL